MRDTLYIVIQNCKNQRHPVYFNTEYCTKQRHPVYYHEQCTSLKIKFTWNTYNEHEEWPWPLAATWPWLFNSLNIYEILYIIYPVVRKFTAKVEVQVADQETDRQETNDAINIYKYNGVLTNIVYLNHRWESFNTWIHRLLSELHHMPYLNEIMQTNADMGNIYVLMKLNHFLVPHWYLKENIINVPPLSLLQVNQKRIRLWIY